MGAYRFISFICLIFVSYAAAGGVVIVKEDVATFAGGCFWCVEADLEALKGVNQVISGFSGGEKASPSYSEVSKGLTKHIEAVQVYYNPTIISYLELLHVFWRTIDPTDAKGQFIDRGRHYTTAIFYHNDSQQQDALKSKKELEKNAFFTKKIVTPILPFKSFYPAEEYHQDYYKKNPIRYKYYRYQSGRNQFLKKTWGNTDVKKKSLLKNDYVKPSQEELRKTLSSIQYNVTQKDATERAYQNPYWNHTEAGIYVDVVSGEPLFSSLDKYDSKTGWPSFKAPLVSNNVIEKKDKKLFVERIEARSLKADSHLGHVFKDGPSSTGLRYCINSAALRFIPKAELDSKGYSEFSYLFN